MIDPFVTARDLRDAITRGETSAEAACERTLARIAAIDPTLHAFLHVDGEGALARARALDRQSGPRGPLHGVPVALKDNIAAPGMPATAGSRMLEGYQPVFQAGVVDRLLAAGAVIVGKTNCDEFSMGSSTEHSAWGPTRNPWSLDRSPGGSSGGSAAAVAAGLVPLALGSDTGGSIRQPAAFCGIVGAKPTYGRVSRYGLIAFASSLDQIGPLARTVDDAELLLDAIAGHDPRDATSGDADTSGAPPQPNAEDRLRVGVPRHLIGDDVDAEVRRAFDTALDALAGAGADVREVTLPHSPLGVAVYYLVATAEASSNLARYDGVRYGFRAPGADALAAMYDTTRSGGFGAEVKRRLMLGTYVLSAGYYDAYYLKAQQVRTLIREDFDRAFETVDVVAMPTTPTPAFALGERLEDPLQMYLADVFTVTAPLAGLPAISVPCGLVGQPALPVGLQFIGRAWNERTVFRAARACETVAPPSAHPAV
ncbi:MAG: Asp-tRNA(Asn)/Glu-tRNA(Gln) amidotransferase subunit GatA [Vicinamibacterales bacterium]